MANQGSRRFAVFAAFWFRGDLTHEPSSAGNGKSLRMANVAEIRMCLEIGGRTALGPYDAGGACGVGCARGGWRASDIAIFAASHGGLSPDLSPVGEGSAPALPFLPHFGMRQCTDSAGVVGWQAEDIAVFAAIRTWATPWGLGGSWGGDGGEGGG